MAVADRGALDGAVGPAGNPGVADPVLAGAVRVGAAIAEAVPTWPRAPLQVLARLHTLAAADLPGAVLGRPRPGHSEMTARLQRLAQLLADSPWSPAVTVAVVHGELMLLQPFGRSDGVVARAAARLTMMSTGLDPRGLTVPEVGHLRSGPEYFRSISGFADGSVAGTAGWLKTVAAALEAGAREGRSIAEAAGGPVPEN